MDIDKSQPRQAATVVVVRDAPGGLEVLLLQRAEKGDHNSGAWVFPGGLVDAGDREAHRHCEGRDDAQASALLGLHQGGLDHFVAAIRESFEEAGLLFADGAAGSPFDLHSEAGRALCGRREALSRGESDLAGLCREFGLRLRADRLHYIAHWLTPAGRAKRFDTRFFLAALPEGQSSAHDEVETVQQIWISPAQALEAQHTRRLMTPTRSVIAQVGAFADTAALLAWARSPRRVERVLPRLAMTAAGQAPVLPWQQAWDEVGRLDPEGRGTAWSELRAGVAVAVAEGVWRVPSAAGACNSYIVNGGATGCTVIDPGSADAAHLDALVAAAPAPVRWVCLLDDDAAQRQAGQALQARTGAQLLAPGGAPGAEPPGLRRMATPGGSHGMWMAQGPLLFSGPFEPEPGVEASLGAEWLAPRQGFLRRLRRSEEVDA